MTSLGDYQIALRMRDLIKKLVFDEVEMQRPRLQYATVISIDRVNRKCVVQYPGGTTQVAVNMGAIQPSAVGQTVRIDGLMGDRFISDVMGPTYLDAPKMASPSIDSGSLSVPNGDINVGRSDVTDQRVFKLLRKRADGTVADLRLALYDSGAAVAILRKDAAIVNTFTMYDNGDTSTSSDLVVGADAWVGTHTSSSLYKYVIRRKDVTTADTHTVETYYQDNVGATIRVIKNSTEVNRLTVRDDGNLIIGPSGGVQNTIVNFPTPLGDTEDLNTLTNSCTYNQPLNANASTTRNYPENLAGLLEVFRARSDGGMIHQRYSTYNGRNVWWRTYYNSVWNPWVAVGFKNVIWRGYAATSQTKASGSNASVTLTLDYSTDGDLPSAGASYVRTIVQSGYYRIVGQVTWAANGTGTRSLEFRKNITGTDLSTGSVLVRSQNPGSSTSLTSNLAEWKGYLQAGDTIAFSMLQTSGGNLDVIGTIYQTWIEIELQRPA